MSTKNELICKLMENNNELNLNLLSIQYKNKSLENSIKYLEKRREEEQKILAETLEELDELLKYKLVRLVVWFIKKKGNKVAK